MEYFYARVSTKEQNLDRQFQKARELSIPDDRVYADKLSGKNTNRPEWKKLNNILNEGDSLVLLSLSRLSRSLKDVIDITTDLTERGVSIRFLKECIDTSSSVGRMMLGVVGSVFEYQRDIIVESVRDGVSVSIARREEAGILNDAGHKWGGNKKKALTIHQVRILNLWKEKSIKTCEAMGMLKCSRATLYNLKQKC